MIQIVQTGQIAKKDAVLLHVTGNNEELVRRDFCLHNVEPVVRLRPEEITEPAVRRLRATILP